MGEKSKLENLQAKLAKVQADIKAESDRETQVAAQAEIRDSFSDAIAETVATVEKTASKSLRDIGLGIWVAYPKQGDKVSVSALAVGDDGLPKALRRTAERNGTGNGNGNGFTFTLEDGRSFDTNLDAVHALGIATHGDDGEPLDGKTYYHRHDRLPKDIAAKITKAAKPSDNGTGAKSAPADNGTGESAPAETESAGSTDKA